MKLIYPVLPAAILADHANQALQDRINDRADFYTRRINWITERRLVPELVSHEEFVGQEEELDQFAGKYRMERPHVNFWLDFSNQRLLQFRQQSNKYQTAKNMLSTSDRSYGAKKYGLMVDQQWDERNEHYNFYQTTTDERYTRPTKNNLLRRMASLENMIQYAQKNQLAKRPFGAYFDYGCYCFPGSFVDPKHSPHAEPRDPIDSVCREHSWAYDCAKADFGNDCRGKYQEYKWEGTINEDGFTPEIRCLDEVDTCAWAICQADKYLAERLNVLAQDYQLAHQVPLPNEYRPNGQYFDRLNTCYRTHIVEGSRDELEHNNDSIHNLSNGDEGETENTNTPAETTNETNSVTGEVGDNGNLGLFADHISTGDEDTGIPAGSNSPSGVSRQYTPDPNAAVNFQSAGSTMANLPEYDESMREIAESLDWANLPWEFRQNALDNNWPIPEEYRTPSGGNFNPSNPWAGYSGENLNIDLNIDPADAVPYSHQSAVAPETEEELEEALVTVQENVPEDEIPAAVNNPEDGDDDIIIIDHQAPTEDVDPAENIRSGASPVVQNEEATPDTEEDLPDVVLKSAVTYSVRRCCGVYPTRYKYSANKRGCCVHNGVERLYSPHHSQCCQIRAQGARGVYQPYESFLAHKNDNCLNLLANNERHEYVPSMGLEYQLPLF